MQELESETEGKRDSLAPSQITIYCSSPCFRQGGAYVYVAVHVYLTYRSSSQSRIRCLAESINLISCWHNAVGLFQDQRTRTFGRKVHTVFFFKGIVSKIQTRRIDSGLMSWFRLAWGWVFLRSPQGFIPHRERFRSGGVFRLLRFSWLGDFFRGKVFAALLYHLL